MIDEINNLQYDKLWNELTMSKIVIYLIRLNYKW